MWNLSILSPKPLSPAVATIMIALSTICAAFIPLFAKTLTNAGLASPAIVFYRYLLVSILLLPLLTFTSKKRAATFWAMSGGLSIAFGWIAYIEALKSAPVATVGVIYMTFPLFTLLIVTIWLRQVPPRRAWFAGLLIVVAALIALSPASVGSDSLKPLLFSFLAPLTCAYSAIILSDKATQLAPLQRSAAYSFGAALGLLPLILSLDSSVVIPSRSADWLLILGIAMVTYLIPNLVYVFAGPVIGSARAAIAGSFELPVMFVVGWLAFGEQITLLQSVAGLLVLSAICMTSLEPSDDLSEEAELLLLPPSPKTTASSKAA